VRRAVGQRLGLLCGESEAAPNGPGGGEVEEEGQDLPIASLRSGRLRRRAFGACGFLSRRRRRGTAVGRPHGTALGARRLDHLAGLGLPAQSLQHHRAADHGAAESSSILPVLDHPARRYGPRSRCGASRAGCGRSLE